MRYAIRILIFSAFALFSIAMLTGCGHGIGVQALEPDHPPLQESFVAIHLRAYEAGVLQISEEAYEGSYESIIVVWDAPEPQMRYIPWRFTTYAAPAFDAPRLGSFSAQYLRYHYDNGQGWLAINTYGDGVWVYYRADIRHMPRPMGLFYSMGDIAYAYLLSPQPVHVLQQEGRWLQVETQSETEAQWLYLDFWPCTSSLQAFLQQFDNRISVLYKNLETGFIFTYNPGRVYFGASVGKIYSALYIYTLAERGYITLNNIHTYTYADHREGSGRIQHMEEGTQFTTAELLRYSMRFSDNVAYRMLALRYNHPNFTFRDFAEEIGANQDRILSLTAKNIDVTDAALWMYAVHNYIQSNGRYSQMFRNDLFATYSFIGSNNYNVASKYGWSDTAFHDAAIVYAPSPYILIVLSDMGWDTAEIGFTAFANISRMFEAFNGRYFR